MTNYCKLYKKSGAYWDRKQIIFPKSEICALLMQSTFKVWYYTVHLHMYGYNAIMKISCYDFKN